MKECYFFGDCLVSVSPLASCEWVWRVSHPDLPGARYVGSCWYSRDKAIQEANELAKTLTHRYGFSKIKRPLKPALRFYKSQGKVSKNLRFYLKHCQVSVDGAVILCPTRWVAEGLRHNAKLVAVELLKEITESKVEIRWPDDGGRGYPILGFFSRFPD